MVPRSILCYYLDIFVCHLDLEEYIGLFSLEIATKDPQNAFHLVEKVSEIVDNWNVF